VLVARECKCGGCQGVECRCGGCQGMKCGILIIQERRHPRVLVVYSVLQELARREGLRTALAGLDESQLEPVLKYLARHLSQPQCAPLLLDVANIVAGEGDTRGHGWGSVTCVCVCQIFMVVFWVPPTRQELCSDWSR